MSELNYKDFLKKHNMVDSFDSFAVWNHQQAIIDDLKTQLNNMGACYIEKKKQGEGQQKRIDEALSRIDESKALVDDPYDIVSDVEKALRGKHES